MPVRGSSRFPPLTALSRPPPPLPPPPPPYRLSITESVHHDCPVEDDHGVDACVSHDVDDAVGHAHGDGHQDVLREHDDDGVRHREQDADKIHHDVEDDDVLGYGLALHEQIEIVDDVADADKERGAVADVDRLRHGLTDAPHLSVRDGNGVGDAHAESVALLVRDRLAVAVEHGLAVTKVGVGPPDAVPSATANAPADDVPRELRVPDGLALGRVALPVALADGDKVPVEHKDADG